MWFVIPHWNTLQHFLCRKRVTLKWPLSIHKMSDSLERRGKRPVCVRTEPLKISIVWCHISPLCRLIFPEISSHKVRAMGHICDQFVFILNKQNHAFSFHCSFCILFIISFLYTTSGRQKTKNRISGLTPSAHFQAGKIFSSFQLDRFTYSRMVALDLWPKYLGPGRSKPLDWSQLLHSIVYIFIDTQW